MKKLIFVFGFSMILWGCDYEIVKKDEIVVSKKNEIDAIEKVKSLEVEKNKVAKKLLETEAQLEEVVAEENEEANAEKVNSFILNYSETYCRMRSLENRFWLDYNSERFIKEIKKNGSDIPTMNFIVKMSMNRLKRSEVETILDRCNSIYPARMNTLNFAFTHLNNFFEGSAKLKGFEEFKKDVAPELGAFREAVEEAPGYLVTAFMGYEVDNPFLREMESVCDIRLSLNKGRDVNQDDVANFTSDLPKPIIDYPKLNSLDDIFKTTDEIVTIKGTVDSRVQAVEINGFRLKKFKPGETSFSYVANSNYGNMKQGINAYKIVAIGNNQEKSFTELQIEYLPIKIEKKRDERSQGGASRLTEEQIREYWGGEPQIAPQGEDLARYVANRDSNEDSKKEAIFDRNQECLRHKKDIEQKISTKGGLFGSEASLESIFFSPKENECLYIENSEVDFDMQWKRLFSINNNGPSVKPIEGCTRAGALYIGNCIRVGESGANCRSNSSEFGGINGCDDFYGKIKNEYK